MHEFMYVDDVADASLFVHNLPRITFDENTKSMPYRVNVGTGTELTIEQQAQILKDVVEFNGEIVFDRTKPDGTMQKLMNVSLLTKLVWKSEVFLRKGLQRSYTDFLSTL